MIKYKGKDQLELCDSEEHMNERERAILTLEHVNNPNCYNCRVGGEGGWGHWLNSEEAHQSRLKGGRNSGVRELNASRTKDEWRRLYEMGLKKWVEKNGNPASKFWTPETKKLQRDKVLGEGNPMYGKRWVCSPEGIAKIIDNTELAEYKKNGWVTGKRPKDTNKGSYDRCWINNGEISKFIPNSELTQWMKDGWIKGRLSFIGK